MKPKRTESRSQEELYRSRLEQIFDLRHSLCQLANRIHWESFVQEIEALYVEEMERVNVDTTVQEKAISSPTNARLYQKASEILVKQAVREGIRLRQSYQRLGKLAILKQGRYTHAKQIRRARRESR